MENDNDDINGNIEQDEFHIRDNLGAILEQYLGREELEELIVKKIMFSTMICHKEPHRLMSSTIFN